MNIIKKEIIYPSCSHTFNIIPLGDIHLGNIGCDIKKLTKIITWIKETPRTFWIGTGDYTECINIDDPRFDELSVDPDYRLRGISRLITQQMRDIVALLRPIQNKCIGLVSGNHEETIRLRYKRDIMYEIAERLHLQHLLLGYDGWIRLQFIRKPSTTIKLRNTSHTSYTIYISHGFGAARKSGAKVNRLEDFTTFMDADIIILGHEHKKIIAPPVIKLYLTQEGNLSYRKQIALMAGSFLRGYVENATTYIEKKGYPPSDLGVVKIMLKPAVHDIHASI
jgi:hypothetical protein